MRCKGRAAAGGPTIYALQARASVELRVGSGEFCTGPGPSSSTLEAAWVRYINHKRARTCRKPRLDKRVKTFSLLPHRTHITTNLFNILHRPFLRIPRKILTGRRSLFLCSSCQKVHLSARTTALHLILFTSIIAALALEYSSCWRSLLEISAPRPRLPFSASAAFSEWAQYWAVVLARPVGRDSTVIETLSASNLTVTAPSFPRDETHCESAAYLECAF